MLGQIVSAQFALESVIADLSGNPSAISALQESQVHLTRLSGLMRQLATADPASLASLQSEIATAVAAGQAAVAQGQSLAAGGDMPEVVLAHAVEASRRTVDRVMAGMGDFEPYLHFANAEDETEYRAREAERRAYIAAQEDKRTPQGQLNASGAAMGQMIDAHAHGAGDSPEFKAQWDELVATTEKLREAAKANGVSTEEFDQRLRADLRRILKSKGLSDVQIDAQFAAHPDPLDAAKVYMKGDADVTRLKNNVEWIGANVDVSNSTERQDMRGLFASLKSSGVVSGKDDPDAVPSHGVSTARLPTDTVRSL